MRFLVGVVFATLLAAPSLAGAQEAPAHSFGLGLMLGAPSGLSAKYYFGEGYRGGAVAIQGGLGVVERVGDDGVHLHIDLLWHPTVLTSTPSFALPFYVGGGLRFLEHDDDYCYFYGPREYCYDDDDSHIGLRVPVGLLMDFKRVPLDVFFELALVLDLIHIDHGDDYYDHDHDTLLLNGAIGARYYF